MEEYIIGIITHENQKIFKSFESAAEYIKYKRYARSIVEQVSKMMLSPYALQGVHEALTNDSPYVMTAIIAPLETPLGTLVKDYIYESIVFTLSYAQKISGGAIQWYEHEKDDHRIIFVYVDTKDTKERWDWMNNALSDVATKAKKLKEEPTPNFSELEPEPEDETDLRLN